MTEQDMIIQDLRRENAELRASAPKWISVEDRLPSAEVDVLVLTRSKGGSVNVDKGYFAADLGRFVHRGRAEVSHWMPIPEPPKEVEE